MKRKIIASIAAAALVITTFAGCSDNKGNSSPAESAAESVTESIAESTASTTTPASSTSATTSAEVPEETQESVPTVEPSEPTTEPAESSEPEVSKKTISLVDEDDNYYFGDIEVPLDNNGEGNQYLQQIYDKGIVPEGTYAGTEILIKEDGSGACIVFNGNSVNHGNVPVYDFGYTTDWEPTPIEEDDKIWDEVIVPYRAGYIEKAENKEIGFVDFNKNGTSELFEASIISMITSNTYELRGIIYL